MSVDRPKLVLSPVDCDGCGRCVEACRRNAIRPGANYIYVDWSRCDGCGKCADLCDRDAIALRAADGTAVRAEDVFGAGSGAGSGPSTDGAGLSGRGRGISTGVAARALAKARLWRPKLGLPGVVHGDAGPAAETEPAVRWSLPEAVVVLVVAVLLQLAMRSVLDSEGVRALTERGIMLARGLVLAGYYAAQVGLVFALALRRRVGVAEAHRLDAPPDFASLPLGLSMLVGTWLFSMVYRWAAVSAGWAPPAADAPSLTEFFGADAVGLTLTVLVVVVLGPFVEELLLRGVVLDALDRRFGRWWGIAASAVAFALLHGSAWSLLPMTFLGLALGRLASRRRSLWPAVALHVAYNAVIVAPAFIVAARGG
jgi:membrane protease YdiL (CAAX protease family)/NAD-dependent dihydropyrimidine dehydrogenase PreA subunit